MRKIVETCVLLVVVFVLFVGYLYLNQRHMMYGPDTERPIPVAGAEVIRVHTADGLELEGWYFAPADARAPIIVHFHGNVGHVGHRVEKIEPYIRAGYGALLVGYRGYGGNSGQPTEAGLYHDARAHLHYMLQNLKISPDQIVLYGESLGSGVAVQMATEYNVRAVVLEAPYTSTVDVARLTYFFLPLEILMHDQYRSIDKVRDLSAPVLIVHGQRDRVIPFALGRRLYEVLHQTAPQQGHRFIPIENAGHNDLYEHNAPLHVLQFLRSIEGQE